jgi:predicted RNase H-like HicB family nuclease
MIPIDYDLIIFKEENTYVAYCPELDISSCGHNVQHAKEMLNMAIKLFLEEAEKMGTLEDILEEAQIRPGWAAPNNQTGGAASPPHG